MAIIFTRCGGMPWVTIWTIVKVLSTTLKLALRKVETGIHQSLLLFVLAQPHTHLFFRWRLKNFQEYSLLKSVESRQSLPWAQCSLRSSSCSHSRVFLVIFSACFFLTFEFCVYFCFHSLWSVCVVYLISLHRICARRFFETLFVLNKRVIKVHNENS